MKIILLQDEKKLGKKGEIIEASEGYARNYILPKKIGVEATPKNLNDLKLQKAAEEKHRQEVLAEAQALGEQIMKMSVTLKIKSGEGGRTFGSVSTKEIAVAMKEQLKLDVDKKKLVLPEPIRTLGTTIVPVKLHPEVTSELTVKVVEA